jgi:4'-phosphopantetheinyl transferase
MKDGIYAIRLMSEQHLEKEKPRLMKLIPRDQKPWMENFAKAKDRQRSLLGECIARWALSRSTGIPPEKQVIQRTEKGKPWLNAESAPFFNVSHSGEWIVVALSEQNVGVDVERIRTPVYRVAKRYFSPKEVRFLNALDEPDKKLYFFDLWTLKESYLKLLGKGLTRSLGSFSIVRKEGLFQLESEGRVDESIYFRMPLLDPGYKLAVCSYSSDFSDPVNIVTTYDLTLQNGLYEHAG